MKQIASTAVALTLGCLTMAANAAANPDASFYKKAAEGGLAEVQLGTMAQDKSPTASVKDFGGMMVSDHTAANDKLKSIAANKGIKLPTSPSVGQMATKAKLDVLTGTSFDKAYIKAMVADHEATIKLFQNEASSGQDSDAKAFATATLPTLQTHLTKIQALASAQGVTVK
jgi:putative membrane protein